MEDTSQLRNEELVRRVLEMGGEAQELLRRFGREIISAEELVARLPELGTAAFLAKNWATLTRDPDLAACLEVLQLLSSLESEIGYQILRYGATSLHEDSRELDLAMKRLKSRRAAKGA